MNLVSPPEESPAAEANDAAVVPEVLLARLGLLLAHVADLQVSLMPGIFHPDYGIVDWSAVVLSHSRLGPGYQVGHHG